jgi:hypothetical protein
MLELLGGMWESKRCFFFNLHWRWALWSLDRLFLVKTPMRTTGCFSLISTATKLVSSLFVMKCWKPFRLIRLPSLPIFFANLQSIKTSHRSSIVIPRSFKRQYSPGASSSGNHMSGFGSGLILILNHHASCFLWECEKFARIDCIFFNLDSKPLLCTSYVWFCAIVCICNSIIQLYKFRHTSATVSDEDGPPEWAVMVKTIESNNERRCWSLASKIRWTNKFKYILVLLSEPFRKGRFCLFPFSTSTSQVHSETIVVVVDLKLQKKVICDTNVDFVNNVNWDKNINYDINVDYLLSLHCFMSSEPLSVPSVGPSESSKPLTLPSLMPSEPSEPSLMPTSVSQASHCQCHALYRASHAGPSRSSEPLTLPLSMPFKSSKPSPMPSFVSQASHRQYHALC